MISVFACLLFAHVGQGVGPDMWMYKLPPRPSVAKKTIGERSASTLETKAKKDRKDRIAKRKRNQEEIRISVIRKVKPDTVVVSSTRRDEFSYVASVTIPVLGDDQRPLPRLATSVRVVNSEGAETVLPVTADELGVLHLDDVPLPAEIEVRSAGSSGEWSPDLSDSEGDPLLIDKPTTGIAPSIKISRSQIGQPIVTETMEGKTKRRVVTTRYLQKIRLSGDAVVLRREVMDFKLSKADLPVSLRTIAPRVFLGNEAMKLVDGGEAWSFRASRDRLPISGVMFVAQYDAPHALLAGELWMEKPDIYAANALVPKNTILEAIPKEAITLAGKPIGDGYGLSPLQWSNSEDDYPKVSTGLLALQLLGCSGELPTAEEPLGNAKRWIQVPEKSGRYGEWVWLEDLGIGLHCRWEPEEGNADKRRKGQKYLPGRKSLGVMDVIRVTSPAGGSIGGAMQVGASRESVLDAFGAPDSSDIDVADLLGLSRKAGRNAALMGDDRIEAWDESFLNGGLRVKWQGGRLKWFEIARPVQMLFNGTRAFQPPEIRKVFLRNVTVEGGWYKAEEVGVQKIEQLLKLSTGVTQTMEAAGADLVVDVRFVVPPKSILRTLSDADVFVEIEGIEGKALYTHKIKNSSSLPRAFANTMASSANIVGTVLGVNYETGSVLINLGRDNGIRPKEEEEGTELAMYLLYEVNSKTGKAVGPIEDEAIIGPKSREWLEVQKVGPNWCIAKPKTRDGLNHTVNAASVLARMIDPSSGLLRVRVVKKRGS